MAIEKQKTFPMLPVAHWWTLRERFNQTMPGVVTANYLATALNIEPRSASNNVLPYLKDIGLIDDEGKIKDLAISWRDDNQYAEVCQKIKKEVYPNELISAVPSPSEDRKAVERWFANRTGLGKKAVQRMAVIYIVISEGDLSKKPQKKTKVPIVKKSKVTVDKGYIKSTPPILPSDTLSLRSNKSPQILPGININLEIHISSDATPDQIDRIFESMAKHIYKRNNDQ